MAASVWNEEGGSVRKVAKEEVKCTAGGGGVPHRWVRRREVHGSDYKEASGGVGECEGEGGLQRILFKFSFVMSPKRQMKFCHSPCIPQIMACFEVFLEHAAHAFYLPKNNSPQSLT